MVRCGVCLVMSSFRRVLKYNAGKKDEAGILIEGRDWANVPKGCRMLTPDLVGKFVEAELADLNGDGNYYIVELKIEGEPTRFLKDYQNKTGQGAKEVVSDWFEVYKLVSDKLVPKGIGFKDTYLIEAKEKVSAEVATAIWLRLRQEKVK